MAVRATERSPSGPPVIEQNESAATTDDGARNASGTAVTASRSLVVPFAVLILEACVLAVLHLSAFVGLSPVDELMHFDNLVRSSHPDLAPEPGAQLSQETLREVSCHETYHDSWRLAPAGASCLRARHNASDYWWRGLNPSIGHVPLYYLSTGILARLLRAAIPSFGLLTWARLIGVLWAVGGCYLTLRAGRTLGVSRWAVTAALALVLAVPSQLAAMTMVNPDAGLLLVGGALLFVAVQIDSAGWSRLTVVPTAAVAVLVDPSAFVAIFIAAGYLLLRSVAEVWGERRWRSALAGVLTSGSALVLAMATYEGWGRVFGLLTKAADFSGDPQDRLYQTLTLPRSLLLGRTSLLAMFPPVAQPNAPQPLQSERVAVFVALAGLLLVGSAVAGLLRGSSDRRHAWLVASTVVTLLITPPLLILWNYVFSHWYFSIPSRYGIAALPALSLIVASTASARLGRAVVGALAGGLVLSTVSVMMIAPT